MDTHQQLGVFPGPHDARRHDFGITGGLPATLNLPLEEPDEWVKGEGRHRKRIQQGPEVVGAPYVDELVREDRP